MTTSLDSHVSGLFHSSFSHIYGRQQNMVVHYKGSIVLIVTVRQSLQKYTIRQSSAAVTCQTVVCSSDCQTVSAAVHCLSIFESSHLIK